MEGCFGGDFVSCRGHFGIFLYLSEHRQKVRPFIFPCTTDGKIKILSALGGSYFMPLSDFFGDSCGTVLQTSFLIDLEAPCKGFLEQKVMETEVGN